MSLAPKHGFDWSRVRWDDSDEPARDDCSYCGVPIEEEGVPLRIWNERKDGAVFCQACMVNWWGFSEPFTDPEDLEPGNRGWEP